MKKISYENNTYFVGENSTYIEMVNIKEFIDSDGIKRFLIELKDKNKINDVKNRLKSYEKGEDYKPIKNNNKTNTNDIDFEIPSII